MVLICISLMINDVECLFSCLLAIVCLFLGKMFIQYFCTFFPFSFLIFIFQYLFIYLLLAVLGLRFCARAFSSCGEWGPLFIAMREPLTIAGSLVAEHRLQTRRLSSCGSRG